MSPSPNFLGQIVLPPDHSSPSRPHPKKRRRFTIIVLMAAVVLVGGAGVFAASSLTAKANAIRRDVERVQSDVARQDFSAAVRDLSDAEARLDRVREELQSTSGLQYFPYIGTQWRAVSDASFAGREALSGLKELALAMQAVEEGTGVSSRRSFQDLSAEEKRSILARFEAQLPRLREARDRVGIALEAWDRIPQDRMAYPLRVLLGSLAKTLPVFKTQLDEMVRLAELAVPLFGYPKPKTFLILLQNADELRPSGGFIGTIGILTVDGGEIKRLEFQDVYAIDGLSASAWKDAPPEPMLKYLGVKAWFLRDRNWSPDFSVSAEQVIQTFEREVSGSRFQVSGFDGVIAFEPEFFRRLLVLTGPITVEGKTFTAENFFTELEYDVEQGFLTNGIPVRQRKEIVKKVGDELVARMFGLPSSVWPELLRVLTDSLDQKDLLVYTRDPRLQSMIDARGWSGRTRSTEGDYLEVVDANLAALKTDGVMDKRIRYEVDVTTPGGLLATVTLKYMNTNRKIDWRRTRYRDYVRVYVPEGSELVSSEGAMQNDKHLSGGVFVPGTVDVMRDLGKTVFGAFWSLEPGESRELKFVYRLPPSIVGQGSYQLLVQKQPGSNTRLTVDVLFGKKVQAADPPEDVSERGDARYRIKDWLLTKDQTFHVW